MTAASSPAARIRPHIFGMPRGEESAACVEGARRQHPRRRMEPGWRPSHHREQGPDGLDLGHKDGHLQTKLEGHGDLVRHAAWSHDGQRMVTVSSDQTARIWAADSGLLLGKLDGHGTGLMQASWSPDGHRILTIGGKTGCASGKSPPTCHRCPR